MELKDIIKNESDRIFMVDPECFIIFTGNDIADPQPFIRIGNWPEIPVEIIPQIENIIIPDRMIGNPAYEQFNIDIDYLPTNRYIGSSSIVNRFLNYQQIFGLDLKNASVVDAEKDIPEITGKKMISDKDLFTGIFYSDGNFRINHKKKQLFDLNEALRGLLGDIAMHEKLTRIGRKIDTSGFFITDGNPMFFNKNMIVSYLFPFSYYEKFSKLGINPRYISAILHPSENFLSVTRFFKWKNYSRSKVSVYCDSLNDSTQIKSLFSDAQINPLPFSGMKFQSGGFEITNIHDSYNVMASYDTESGVIRCGFLKGIKSIKTMISSKPDIIIISYSAYEDTALMLKSSAIPYAIIEDANPNYARFCKTDSNHLYHNLQYQLFKSSQEKISSEINDKVAFTGLEFSLTSESYLENTEILLTDPQSLNSINLINLIGSIKFIELFSTSRKLVSKAKDIIRNFYSKHGEYLKQTSEGLIISVHISGTVLIHLCDGRIPSEIIINTDNIDETTVKSLSGDEADTAKKIISDRARLMLLLKKFPHIDERKAHVSRLDDAILKRKNVFSQEIISKNDIEELNNIPEENGNRIISAISSFVGKKNEKHANGEASHHEFTRNDFKTDNEIKTLCTRIRNENFKADGFSVPETSSDIDWLNSIIRSSAFPVAWMNSSLRKKTKITAVTKTMLKNFNSLFSTKFSKLDGSGKNKIAMLNRRLIDESFLNKEKTIIPLLGKKSIWVSGILIAAIIISAICYLLVFKKSNNENEINQTDGISLQSTSISDQKGIFLNIDRESIELKLSQFLPKKTSLVGMNYEIFVMANRIAITNGYSPILEEHFDKKNPNWIYPGNLFILPSGEKITVMKGDTLWAIAEKFLIFANENFRKNCDLIKKHIENGDKVGDVLISNARNWAFTQKDTNELNEIIKDIKQ